MTAPIQEPTYGRTTSGLGYGQRQLFRRPQPRMVETAFFRAYFMRYTGSPKTTPITGIGTTNQELLLDWWENSDTSVFEPRAAATYSNPPVMSTDLIDRVRLLQRGHYTITVGLQFDNSTYGWKWDWNDSDIPFGFADTFTGGGDRDETTPDVYQSVGFQVGTITRIYPLPAFGTDPPTDYWPADLGIVPGALVEGYITIGSLNASGINDNEINYGYLEILYQPLTIPPA